MWGDDARGRKQVLCIHLGCTTGCMKRVAAVRVECAFISYMALA